MYLCQGRIFLKSSAYRLFQQYRGTPVARNTAAAKKARLAKFGRNGYEKGLIEGVLKVPVGVAALAQNCRAPTARIQARKDVDLAVDDVLNRVNRCCKRQIGERVEHPPSLPIRLLENTLEELD